MPADPEVLKKLTTVKQLAQYLAENPPEAQADFEAFKAVLFFLKHQEKEMAKLRGAVKVLAKVLSEMGGAQEAAPPPPPGGSVVEEDANPLQDKTPFPSGVAAGPGTNPAPAAAVDESEEDPLRPNVGSGPAMNAAPIPKPSAAKQPSANGSKA